MSQFIKANKSFRFNVDIIKSEGQDKGTFHIEGYAATSGLDRQGDIILHEALKRAAKKLETVNNTVFFGHTYDLSNSVGRITGTDVDEHGLKVKIYVSEWAKELRTKLKEGIINKFSIGGRVLKDRDIPREEAIKQGLMTESDPYTAVKLIEDIELFEVSFVGVPANPEAEVVGTFIKALHDVYSNNIKEESEDKSQKGGGASMEKVEKTQEELEKKEIAPETETKKETPELKSEEETKSESEESKEETTEEIKEEAQEEIKEEETIEKATGKTTPSGDHLHDYSVDEDGNGATTSTLPVGDTEPTEHVHEISDWKVLSADGHTHELAKEEAPEDTKEETVEETSEESKEEISEEKKEEVEEKEPEVEKTEETVETSETKEEVNEEDIKELVEDVKEEKTEEEKEEGYFPYSSKDIADIKAGVVKLLEKIEAQAAKITALKELFEEKVKTIEVHSEKKSLIKEEDNVNREVKKEKSDPDQDFYNYLTGK